MSLLNRSGISIWISLLLVAWAALSAAACSDDTSGEGKPSGSAGTTTSSAGSSTGGGSTDTGADAYCAKWVQKCGPNNPYNIVIPVTLKNFATIAACKPYYESSSAECKECLQVHTEAVHDGSWDHCIHGAGESLDPKCGCVIN